MTSVTELFRQPCEFQRGASGLEHLPPPTLPEVAFAGRSNVGKSSLLNALLKRRQLARTSKTPGCTREVNFYLLAEKMMLADVPGYGYARASKTAAAGWNQLIRDYLRGRPNLRRVFLLIDSRHGVMPIDEEIMNMLDEAAVTYQIVYTKTDKQTKAELEKMIASTLQMGVKHTALFPVALATSSEKNTGLDDVRRVIAEFVK